MSDSAASARILLIDDEMVTREVVKELLEALDYEVLVAEAGRPGLELLQTNPVDVVITDYSLPDMDGSAVAEEIQQGWPNMPIILLTGWGASREKIDTSRFAFVLGKPCRLDQLADALDGALGRETGAA